MNLQEVSDRLEIEDLLTRYATGLDRRDWAQVRSVLAEDAVLDYTAFDGPRSSPEEALAWVEEALGAFDVVEHHLANVEVEVSGDEATARCYLFNPMGTRGPDGSVRFFYVGGRYHDRLRRTAGGWRIAERVAVAEWFDTR